MHCTAHINQEIKTFLVSKKRIPHPDDICNAVKQSNLISIDNQHILAHFSITCKQVKWKTINVEVSDYFFLTWMSKVTLPLCEWLVLSCCTSFVQYITTKNPQNSQPTCRVYLKTLREVSRIRFYFLYLGGQIPEITAMLTTWNCKTVASSVALPAIDVYFIKIT